MNQSHAQMTQLLHRAQNEGLIARRHHRNPRLMLVSSSRDSHVWYRVTRTSCTCKAHQHYGVCKHRMLAIYAAERGLAPFRGQVIPVVTAVVVCATIPGPLTQAVRDGWKTGREVAA